MKRQGYLFDGIVTFDNLWFAAHRAWRGKKDRPRIAEFYFHLERELLQLRDDLIDGSYQPLPYRMFTIREPKERRIAAADFRDRVVHHAICRYLEPLFERSMIYDSYACRKGKGGHKAVLRAQLFTRRYNYFLKGDIRHFFACIDHTALKQLLWRRIKDVRLMALLETIIDHPLEGQSAGKGLPIGNLTSQYFANLYLDGMDHYLKDVLRAPGYVRYMDDFLLFAREKPVLHRYLAEIERFLKENLRLRLKAKATRLAPVTEGVGFLGLRIYPGTLRIQGRGVRRVRRRLRRLHQDWRRGVVDERALADSSGSMLAHLAQADSLGLRRCLCRELNDGV